MSSTEDDPCFLALSSRLRHSIDDAFDSVALKTTSEVLSGGFVIEEAEPGPSQYDPGGFIVEDIPAKPSGSTRSYIPLEEIPRALNLLDLSPDDDIMGVFENAVTGWGAQNARNNGVSRKDWRAVCAALLEGEDVDGDNEKNPGEDVEMGADSSGPDSDEYQMEESSSYSSGNVSSDEYEEPSTAARATNTPKVAAKTRAGTKGSGTDKSRQLTESQKALCRREFSRFFPHVPDDELDRQQIMIKDIVRVAELLKEDLKAEEILEMLEAFSTSPDKSMNIADFERMMVATKLA